MAKLVFKLSDSQELDYPLNAPLIRLGRDETNNIVIDNSWISTFHATFYRSMDGRLQVEDLNSSNGTFVNGQRIRALKTLRLGDIVTFGQLDALITPSSGDDVDEKLSGLPPVVNHETSKVTLRASNVVSSPVPSVPMASRQQGQMVPMIRTGAKPELLRSAAPTPPTATLPSQVTEPIKLLQTPEESAAAVAAGDLERLKKEIEAALQKKEKLLKEIVQLDADKSGLANTHKDMTAAAEQAQQAVADLVAKKDLAEQRFSTASQQTEATEAKTQALQAQAAQLQTELAQGEKRQTAYAAAKAEQEASQLSLAQLIEAETKSLAALKDQTKDESALAAARSEIAAELQTLQQEREALRTQLTSLQGNLATESAALAKTRELQSEEKAAAAQLAQSHQTIAERKAAAEVEIAELEKTLAEVLRRNEAEQRRQREIVQASREELRIVQDQTKSAREVRDQLQEMQAEMHKLKTTAAMDLARQQTEKQRIEREVDDLVNQSQLLTKEVAEAQFALREQKFAEVEQLKIEALSMVEAIRNHSTDIQSARQTLDETQAAWQTAEQNRTQVFEQLANLRKDLADAQEQAQATRQQIREGEAKLDAVRKTQEIAEQEHRLTNTQLEQVRNNLEIRRKDMQEADLAHQEVRLNLQRILNQSEQSERMWLTKSEETTKLKAEAEHLQTQLRELRSQMTRDTEEAEALDKRKIAALASVQALDQLTADKQAAAASAQESLQQYETQLAEHQAAIARDTEKQRQEHRQLFEEVEIYTSKREQLNIALAELTKETNLLSGERQQSQAACTEAISTLEKLQHEINHLAGTKQALLVEGQALTTKVGLLREQLDTREAEVHQSAVNLQSMANQLAAHAAAFTSIEKEIQRANLERSTWDQIRQLLVPLKEEHRTLEQEIHVLRRERAALLDEATRGAKEQLAALDLSKSTLESQIQEYQDRSDTIARGITPEWGTVHALAKACIKELDLLDDMLTGLVNNNATPETIEQVHLYRASFLRTLEEFSVVPFVYPIGQVLDVRIRKRINILETTRGGTGPSFIAEFLRPGYECLQKGESPPTLLRKCEVVIQAEG